MIISPGRAYVFVHAPKTGGTALSLALEDRAMKDDILIGDTPKAKRRKRRLEGLNCAGRLWKHATFADIQGVLPAAQLARMMVFMLVRNPWDRAVSYYHWLQAQGWDHPAVSAAKSLEFKAFLFDLNVSESLRMNPYASYVAGADHPVFIRLEHLKTDLKPLEAHLGFPIKMPVANASQRERDYRAYYDDESEAWVGAICAQDIAQFGYAFDPKEPFLP